MICHYTIIKTASKSQDNVHTRKKRLLSFSVFLAVFEGANQDVNIVCIIFETTTY